MNYKLEKFWNSLILTIVSGISSMNYKLEKFWNKQRNGNDNFKIWMNYKLEKFWNLLYEGLIKADKNEL